MRYLCVLALVVLTGAVCAPARAENSILVESKAVPTGGDSVSVGLFLTNDSILAALVIPLEIRSLDACAFMADHFAVTPQGRLAAMSAGYSNIRTSPSKGSTYISGTTCIPDSSGAVWRPDGLPPDFTTPDAVLFSLVATDDSMLVQAGSDGMPDSGGTPSVLLTFGVTGALGVFEIDTICMAMGNHLLYAVGQWGMDVIVPSFTKGIIEIGGPFYQDDSISGHIDEDLAINHDVVVTGDLTIDSGVTFTVARGITVHAAAYQDDQAGGFDTTLVEIIVRGTLAIDEFAGDRPEFTSTSENPGAWYGIRITSGGHFNTGIGAEIKKAEIGVSVESQAPADTLSGLVIRECNSFGVKTASSSVALLHDSLRAIAYGYGIYVDSANPKITGCVAESCGIGLLFRYSNSIARDCRIIGPGTYGIRIDNNYLGQQNHPQTEPDFMAGVHSEIGYTVTLRNDTVSGYFSGGQMFMSWSSGGCIIDSCGFVHTSGDQRSPYGLYLGLNDQVTLRRSSVTGYSNTGVYSSRSKANLGVSTSDPGDNVISTDSSGCQGCTLRRVYHNGTDTIRAEGNWWGTDPPSGGWFYGKVDYNPWLGGLPEGQQASLVILDPDQTESSRLSVTNYPNPFNPATTIEFGIPAASFVRVVVYNILGQEVKEIADREFPAGNHRVDWDGRDKLNRGVASGIYLYRVTTSYGTVTRKMTLLR